MMYSVRSKGTFRPIAGQDGPERGRAVAVLFFNLGARLRWVLSATPRPLYPLGREKMPIIYEIGWAPGQVWRGAENLASTRIRSSDRPVGSKSIYRLRHPGPWFPVLQYSNFICRRNILMDLFNRLCQCLFTETRFFWNIFVFKCLQFSVTEKLRMLTCLLTNTTFRILCDAVCLDEWLPPSDES
jgi:hypothetical protein